MNTPVGNVLPPAIKSAVTTKLFAQYSCKGVSHVPIVSQVLLLWLTNMLIVPRITVCGTGATLITADIVAELTACFVAVVVCVNAVDCVDAPVTTFIPLAETPACIVCVLTPGLIFILVAVCVKEPAIVVDELVIASPLAVCVELLDIVVPLLNVESPSADTVPCADSVAVFVIVLCAFAVTVA